MIDVQNILRENEKNIFFFSKTKCPYCVKLENELNKYNLPYTKLLVDSFPEDDLKAIKETTNSTSYPILYIGKTKIGGYTDFLSILLTNRIELFLNEIDIKFDNDF